jgi:hypothetical protein
VANKAPYKCDECCVDLLDIGDEIYCPICEVGDGVELDGAGEVNKCPCCQTKLATSYPYRLCPTCSATYDATIQKGDLN